MTVDRINNFEQLLQLRLEWATFLDSLTDVTPFQSVEWMLTWWKHFGSGELGALAFREAGRLVGLLPIFRHEWAGRQQLTLVGSGISDYLDPPFHPEFSKSIVDEVASALVNDPAWDICDWQDLSVTTPLKWLGQHREFSVQAQADTVCSSIPLGGDFDSYWRERSADHRRNIARYNRKAEAEAPVEFSVDTNPNPLLLDALITLHGARWRKQGEPGTIAANRSAAFLRDIAAELSARSALRLFSLRWKSAVVAVIFGIAQSHASYGYLSAFDPQWEELGFGRNLLFRALRHAVENGYSCWNFLRGDEPYKASWGAVPIPKCRLRITRSS